MNLHLLLRLRHGMQRLASLVALVGLVGLVILAAITVAEVLIRWLFNYGIAGVADVSSLLIAVFLSACFGLVCSRNKHISVSFVADALGYRGSRVLDAFGSLVTVAVFAVITWQMARYALELQAIHDTTWVLLWPKAPWFMAVTILLGLTIPAQLLVLLIDISEAVIGENDNARSSEA